MNIYSDTTVTSTVLHQQTEAYVGKKALTFYIIAI